MTTVNIEKIEPNPDLRCSAKNRGGIRRDKQCENMATVRENGKPLCYFHSSECAEERRRKAKKAIMQRSINRQNEAAEKAELELKAKKFDELLATCESMALLLSGMSDALDRMSDSLDGANLDIVRRIKHRLEDALTAAKQTN